MRLIILITTLILTQNYSICASKYLKGEIGGVELNSNEGPYIIENDVIIPKKSKVIIKPGTVLLFKSFAGINVYGTLLVEGTPEKPVIFTSIFDTAYNFLGEQLPNPFDWNGILIDNNAEDVKLRNFYLRYSVYGIKSHKKDVVIQNGSFVQNGQFNFTIKDEIQYVQDKIFYSYRDKNSIKEDTVKQNRDEFTLKKDPPIDKKLTIKKNTKRKSYKRHPVMTISAIATVILGISAASTSIYYWNEKNSLHEHYLLAVRQDKINSYHEKENRTYSKAVIFAITSSILLPTSVVLFFKKSKKKSTLSFCPKKNFKGGKLTLTYNF